MSTLLLCALPTVALAADPHAAAEITFTDTVIASEVEPVGANLTTLAGGTNFAVNDHVWGSGFEPTVWRRLARIDRADAGWFEWDSLGGPMLWNLLSDGFGDGATVHFYRLVDTSGDPLSYAGGVQDIDGADHVVYLGQATVPEPSEELPAGGWIANDEQQRVYIDDEALELAYGDYAFISLEQGFFPQEGSHPDLQAYWGGGDGGMSPMAGEYVASRVDHPSQPLPADFESPGDSCLQIEATSDGTVALGQYLFYEHDDGEGQWYSQLHPGASYRASAWARQEELGDGGAVLPYFTESYAALGPDEPWQVTGEWQEFSFEFVAPGYPTDHEWHIAFALALTGPGTLWIDNLVLYRDDEQHGWAPYGPHANSFDELMRVMPATGPKPAIRFQPVTYRGTSDPLVASMFGDTPSSAYHVDWYTAVDDGTPMTIAQALRWAEATGDSPETRAVPFLTCSEEYTHSEWEALIEFLGVPYDPDLDSPEDKPWAYARWQHRGDDGAPWTDSFREILLEYGNEPWHNGAAYGWDGFGPPGWVHYGGAEYGLFARFMFDETVMATEAWQEHGLGEKIRFVLGANYEHELDQETTYGELAAAQGASVAYLGHANYVGPKWETDDDGWEVFDDHGVQETLVGMVTSMQELIDGAAASRDSLRDSGIADYRLVAYEGGPSGYWQNEEDPEIDELYGKSVAMGVAALDAWLYSSLRGFGHQCYHAFAGGDWWTSHTMPEAGGLRPHPGWLALELRNLATASEMVEVTMDSAPSYERQGEEIPLISSYALRDEQAWYVFVLSRKLDGEHDGVDFGDGVTPLTLHLPLEAPTGITVHRIAQPDGTPADPRANNREQAQVTIVSEELDPATFSPDFVVDETTGGTQGGLPPGSATLWVFRLTEQDTADPTDSGGQATGDGCGCAGAGGARAPRTAALLVLLLGVGWRRRAGQRPGTERHRSRRRRCSR